MDRQRESRSADPGVPEALPRALIRLRERVGVERIDRMWVFPPVRNGRRERGLLAVSLFSDDAPDRRVVLTQTYQAEETGRGVSFETGWMEEGEAPPERLPGIIEGVVRRSGEEQPMPRQVEIGGAATAYEELLEAYDPAFLEAPQP